MFLKERWRKVLVCKELQVPSPQYLCKPLSSPTLHAWGLLQQISQPLHTLTTSQSIFTAIKIALTTQKNTPTNSAGHLRPLNHSHRFYKHSRDLYKHFKDSSTNNLRDFKHTLTTSTNTLLASTSTITSSKNQCNDLYSIGTLMT